MSTAPDFFDIIFQAKEPLPSVITSKNIMKHSFAFFAAIIIAAHAQASGWSTVSTTGFISAPANNHPNVTIGPKSLSLAPTGGFYFAGGVNNYPPVMNYYADLVIGAYSPLSFSLNESLLPPYNSHTGPYANLSDVYTTCLAGGSTTPGYSIPYVLTALGISENAYVPYGDSDPPSRLGSLFQSNLPQWQGLPLDINSALPPFNQVSTPQNQPGPGPFIVGDMSGTRYVATQGDTFAYMKQGVTGYGLMQILQSNGALQTGWVLPWSTTMKGGQAASMALAAPITPLPPSQGGPGGPTYDQFLYYQGTDNNIYGLFTNPNGTAPSSSNPNDVANILIPPSPPQPGPAYINGGAPVTSAPVGGAFLNVGGPNGTDLFVTYLTGNGVTVDHYTTNTNVYPWNGDLTVSKTGMVVIPQQTNDKFVGVVANANGLYIAFTATEPTNPYCYLYLARVSCANAVTTSILSGQGSGFVKGTGFDGIRAPIAPGSVYGELFMTIDLWNPTLQEFNNEFLAINPVSLTIDNTLAGDLSVNWGAMDAIAYGTNTYLVGKGWGQSSPMGYQVDFAQYTVTSGP
jgi:hypothetical protein